MLRALTPAERGIAQGYFVEERTMKEVARDRRLSMSSVKSAIFRIRQKAREMKKE